MQTATAIDALLDDARRELPDLRLLTDVADRESYRLDETAYLEAGLPGAVALPGSTAEVSALLRLASRHRVPVVPRGAGTGLSGGAAGIEGALTIAVTRMNRILEIDRDNLCVIAQPGVINAELKAAVAAAGWPVTHLAGWLDAVPARAYGWLFWPSIGLLPPAVREGYEFQWGVWQRAVSTWLVATWQAWRPMLPPTFRQMPQALRADRRVGAGSSGGLLGA